MAWHSSLFDCCSDQVDSSSAVSNVLGAGGILVKQLMSGCMLCKAFAHNAKGAMGKRELSKGPERAADGPATEVDPAGIAKEPPRHAGAAIQEQIGRGLRGMFEEVVAQPVPEKLRRLLEELARKLRKD
jgi:Anti-sigma factor NepR